MAIPPTYHLCVGVANQFSNRSDGNVIGQSIGDERVTRGVGDRSLIETQLLSELVKPLG